MNIFKKKSSLGAVVDSNENKLSRSPARADTWTDTLMKKVPVGVRKFFAGIAMASVLASASYSASARADSNNTYIVKVTGETLSVLGGECDNSLPPCSIDLKIDKELHDLFARFVKQPTQQNYDALNKKLISKAFNIKKRLAEISSFNKFSVSLDKFKKVIYQQLEKEYEKKHNDEGIDYNAFERMVRENARRRRKANMVAVNQSVDKNASKNTSASVSGKPKQKKERAKKNTQKRKPADLLAAAGKGNLKIVKKLIKVSSDEDIQKSLLIALNNERAGTATYIARYMSDHDIDFTMKDKKGRTARQILDDLYSHRKKLYMKRFSELNEILPSRRVSTPPIGPIVSSISKATQKEKETIASSESKTFERNRSDDLFSLGTSNEANATETSHAPKQKTSHVYVIPFIKGMGGLMQSPHPNSSNLRLSDLSFGTVLGYELTNNFGLAVLGSSNVDVHGFSRISTQISGPAGLGLSFRYDKLTLAALATLEIKNEDEREWGAMFVLSHPTFSGMLSTNFNKTSQTTVWAKYHDASSKYPLIVEGHLITASYKDTANDANDLAQVGGLRLQVPLGYDLPVYPNLVLGGVMNRMDASPFERSLYGGEVGLSLTAKYFNAGLAYLLAYRYSNRHIVDSDGNAVDVTSSGVSHGISGFVNIDVPLITPNGSVSGGLEVTYLGGNLVIIPKLGILIRW